MIIRISFLFWVGFQVLNIFLLDHSLFKSSHQVSSEISNEQPSHEIFDEFYETFLAECGEDGGAQNESSCGTCGCATGNARLLFPQSTECEVSEETLREIHALILEAFEKINGLSRSSSSRRRRRRHNNKSQNGPSSQNEEDPCISLNDTCKSTRISPPPSPPTSRLTDPTCEEMYEQMKDMIIDILEEIDKLLEWFDDPNLPIKMAQLLQCVACLQERIDFILKQASGISECYENVLGEASVCFTTRLNNKTAQLTQLQQKFFDKSINATIASILATEYMKAKSEFDKLGNASVLYKIIDDLFEMEDSMKVEHILQFGRIVHYNNFTGRLLVYEKLMNSLKSAPEPNEFHGVVFHSFLTRDKDHYCSNFTNKTCVLPQKFVDVFRYSKLVFDDVIEIWKQNIRDQESEPEVYRNLIKAGSPETLNYKGKAFLDTLGKLVQDAYESNPDYLSQTINFASSLRWNNQSYQAFEQLITDTLAKDPKPLEDILRIAIRMKQVMSSLEGPDENKVVMTELFNGLIGRLPSNIKTLVFNDTFTLRSYVNTGHYLYFDQSSPHYQAGNVRVMTQERKANSHKWRFQRLEVKENTYEYKIISSPSEEFYLGSHVPWRWHDFDGKGFEVCTATVPDYIEPQRKYYNWRVKFDSSFGDDEIMLYHVGRKAYLYSSPDSDGDKKLALLDVKGRMSQNARWTITAE